MPGKLVDAAPLRYQTPSGLWVVEPPRPTPPASRRSWLKLRSWWRRRANPQPEDELLDLRKSHGVSPVRYMPLLIGPILLLPVLVVLREPDNRTAGWAIVFGAIMFLYAWLADWLERRSHAFDACLARQGERAERLKRPLAIAMVDLDEFKTLNDAWGHPAGDAALRWVASVLRSGVRTTDVVARYGGEEFVIAFLDSDHERLSDRLESLRRRIAAARLFPDPDGDAMRVSVSIGIATLPSDADSIDGVLECADRRMYRAKPTGRNRLEDGRSTR